MGEGVGCLGFLHGYINIYAIIHLVVAFLCGAMQQT